MEPIPSVFFMQHQTNSKSAEVGEDEQIHLQNLNIFSRHDDAIDFFAVISSDLRAPNAFAKSLA